MHFMHKNCYKISVVQFFFFWVLQIAIFLKWSLKMRLYIFSHVSTKFYGWRLGLKTAKWNNIIQSSLKLSLGLKIYITKHLVCEIAVLTDIILGEITLSKVALICIFFTVCFSFYWNLMWGQKICGKTPPETSRPPLHPQFDRKSSNQGIWD
jgi:hypothetical protein